MGKPTATEIAAQLREMGQRLSLEKGNPYRAKAYVRAAENLVLTTTPIADLIAGERLTEIPGVGDALAAAITDIYNKGESKKLAAMRTQSPAGLLEIMAIPGMRPERVKKLQSALGITTLAQLEKAARTDVLKSTKGFGPAFQTKVLQGLEIMRGPERRHVHKAVAAAEMAVKQIARDHGGVVQVIPAGDLRRGSELVGRMVFVVEMRSGEKVPQTLRSGDTTVYFTDSAHCGITLLLSTGSDEHLAALRERAKKKGLTLDAKGLRRGSRVIAAATEDEIYAALDLPFIAPELRETGAEVKLAGQGKLRELVVAQDIRGVLHAHTVASDGADTLEGMALAARTRGYEYLGLTDHSQTASYAGGLTADEVVAQQREIDRLNKKLGSSFRVFKGIESDILADGSLDYPEEILQRFEFIISSVHSKFKLGIREQTQRILKAVANPHTTILGHVTGRQLLRRPGYEVDMEAILRACAEHGVAIEINAHPWRLDLDWRWCRRGLELGCLFSVDPDAHSTREIDNIRWGVQMARKGGVPRESILSAWNRKDFATYLEQRRSKVSKSGKTSRSKSRRKSRGS